MRHGVLPITALLAATCGRGASDGPQVLSTWDGSPLHCNDGTTVLHGVTTTQKPGDPDHPAGLLAEGTCRFVIESWTLIGADLFARGAARIEVRNSRISGTMRLQEHALAMVQDTRLPNATDQFRVYADGDSQIMINHSQLRGPSTAGGNASGVVDVIDSTVEGLEDDRHDQWSIYVFGNARVRVRGGELIGQAMQSVEALAEVKPARWSAPVFEMRKTLMLERCLATADAWISGALVEAGDTRHVDRVRTCADAVPALVAQLPRNPAIDDLAASWASQLLPLAGKLQQFRDYHTTGDDKDDGGARGRSLENDLVTLGAAFAKASLELRTKTIARLEPARAWLRRGMQHQLGQGVMVLMTAAEDVVVAESPLDQVRARAALDIASAAGTALYDLLAAEPRLSDGVVTFWAPESGNATTWAALELALRALRDELKRVRRLNRDHSVPIGLPTLASIGDRLHDVYDQYDRVVFQ